MQPRSASVSLRPGGGIVTVLLVVAMATTGPTLGVSSHGKVEISAHEPHLTKASSHLLRAREAALEGHSEEAVQSAVPGLRVAEGRVEVEIKLSAVTPALVNTLSRLGLAVDSAHPGYGKVYGRLDPKRLAAITALPEVRVVRQKPRAGRHVGAAENQGDESMEADVARSSLGLDGTGVTIGVLSDSFRDLSVGSVSGTGCNRAVTDTSSQVSGDLPNGAGEVISLDDGPGGGSDEGRAMGELMFDVAPGATFMFRSAFYSPTDFAIGIGELVSCGADVIVDDVFWTNQPFFQDGEIAEAAQDAVDAGVPFFSAAGNDATFGINDFFTDSDPASDMAMSPDFPNGDDFHDFGGGDVYAAITLPNGCEIFSELQWAEPFASAGPPEVGAHSDLDLYLLSSATDPAGTGGANILTSSTTRQGCGTATPDPDGDPNEDVTYANTTGASDTVFLAIDHFCGATNPLELRVVNISFDCDPTEAGWTFESPIFIDAQIFGHPAAAGAVAVAASYYAEIDSLGAVDPPGGQIDVEPYSSLGGDLPFYFDSNGASAPNMRFKPEITAPDGVNNTFFGSDAEPDGDPNFFGTSAAAPNAAAVAALMLEATGENLTPHGLKYMMIAGALDIETPESPGVDPLSGAGRLVADRVLRSLVVTQPPLIDDLELQLDGHAFLEAPLVMLQLLEANDKLTLGEGDFSGVESLSSQIVLTEGFETSSGEFGHIIP